MKGWSVSLLLMGVMYLYGVQKLEFQWKVKDFQKEEDLVVNVFKEVNGYKQDKIEYMIYTVHQETEKIVHGVDGAHGLSLYQGQYCIGFILVEYNEIKNEMYLSRLAVRPTMQGRGLGKKLVQKAYEKFKPKKMTVMTRKQNRGSIKFYEKIGFYQTDWLLPGRDTEKYCGLWCDSFKV